MNFKKDKVFQTTRYSKPHLQARTKITVIASPMATPSSTILTFLFDNICVLPVLLIFYYSRCPWRPRREQEVFREHAWATFSSYKMGKKLGWKEESVHTYQRDNWTRRGKVTRMSDNLSSFFTRHPDFILFISKVHLICQCKPMVQSNHVTPLFLTFHFDGSCLFGSLVSYKKLPGTVTVN